jgi:hypothetical protein
MRLGCWISLCYDPFSLGARFEIYETLSLILQFFPSRGKPLITKIADTESVDTGARLYIYTYICYIYICIYMYI